MTGHWRRSGSWEAAMAGRWQAATQASLGTLRRNGYDLRVLKRMLDNRGRIGLRVPTNQATHAIGVDGLGSP